MVGGASPATAAKKKRGCAARLRDPEGGDAAAGLRRGPVPRQPRARTRGLRGLRRSAELTQAAVGAQHRHGRRQYFAHDSLDGETRAPARAAHRLLPRRPPAWSRRRSPCGWAQLSTPRALVPSLMRSASHQQHPAQPPPARRRHRPRARRPAAGHPRRRRDADARLSRAADARRERPSRAAPVRRRPRRLRADRRRRALGDDRPRRAGARRARARRRRSTRCATTSRARPPTSPPTSSRSTP